MTILRSIPYKWLVAIAFVSGLVMDILDTTIVNVALPTIGREFEVGESTLEWVVTGYLLNLAIWIPASGWIGDRFGTKRTFLFALIVFTAGSALCGRAWNIESLIAFRFLQGMGGGMLTPVGTAMLFRAFPANERARASSVLAVPTVIAPALGPILGGWLVDNASWRWIFDVNVPVGILGFAFAFLVLREHTEKNAGPFDVWGFLLSGAGLALILFALSRGPNDGWTAPRVLGSGLIGVLLLTVLVWVELRADAPILCLRLFADRMFRNANIASFASSASLLGVLFLLPLFLQQLRGASALESGLTTFPQALGMVAAVQVAGRLYSGVGPRRLMIFGLSGIAITTASFLFIGLDTSLWWMRAAMLFRGVFMAFTIVPLQAATFSTITPSETGRASSLFSTNRQVASSVGVAVLATVLISQMGALASPGQAPSPQAGLGAFHAAFFTAVIIAGIGAAFAFLIRDEDAAASMGRSPTAAESPDASNMPSPRDIRQWSGSNPTTVEVMHACSGSATYYRHAPEEEASTGQPTNSDEQPGRAA